MINVNIPGIQEAFTRMGRELIERCAGETPPVTLEELYGRFLQTNGWAERELRMRLDELHPGVGWSAAELDFVQQQSPEDDGPYWVLDAVDSMMHLHQGMSLWAMSLCLIEGGMAVFSIVYDPHRGEFFHAVRGGGAYLNGTPIRAARKTALSTALLATAPPAVPVPDPAVTEAAARSFARLLPEAFLIRMMGSVALQLAYVACGRLDAYWEYGKSLYNWAAGALLVSEAQGSLTGPGGEPFTWGCTGIIAGHEPLRAQIQAVLHP
ncbi:inositol monophosphatase family protein [Paenibacillus mucilaginosus]|uniref:Putative inositol-1-monophosphatase n=1 Tax=Paenibacillus mucilaginosus (strain KNP414) TaxID=1036673 RepID=F8FBV9_PAEMK|nr:inositol monophosphatase family protein [Paenibacillus mucilaginosus]AEI43720.1 putative inositol-1-monophosphatase [Paenibacillus mucilaginosus KNP414]MCG7212754.1 inositol monophosphatase [Paenibacillus mucilaginosus]WDM25232.1 inositol monophosphatase [Paenibacillus mucilaginosus]